MNSPAPRPSGMPMLTEETFDKFRALIYEKTGIHMRDGKQILISNRLAQAPRAAELSQLRGILRPAHLGTRRGRRRWRTSSTR